MRAVHIVLACLLLSGITWAQAKGQDPGSLPASGTDLASEVQALREALSQTQKQVAAQQAEIQTLKTQSKAAAMTPATDGQAPVDRTYDLASPVLGATGTYDTASAGQSSAHPAQQTGNEGKTPTGSFQFNNAVMEIGGFVDFENIFRTTNTGNNIATAFGSIPYSNTAQGQVTEFRSTAQYSRFDVKFAGNFEGNQITAYLETDFSGNDAANVYQTVNSTTQRLRLYFADIKRGKWEFLGGQTWSWLTPNRNGLGPMPNELALTYNEDQNLMVGVPYTRAAEFRAAYHPNANWAMGVGIEDPNQYIGTYVALPVGFTSIGSQFDNNNNAGAANLMPDILSKVTYDKDFSGRHFHAEVTGLVAGAHAAAMPVGSTTFRTHSVIGGGGGIAANYELVPHKLVVLANAFWSDGGAHYLVATGPQLVIRPNPEGNDISLSMVHAGAGSAGLEWRATPKQAFAVYYGADYFGQNFFPDTTNTMKPGTIIGFGGPGSPNTNNRTIQQATFDWISTFWTNPRHGALQAYTQYSYLTRAPWYVAPGTPKNAHLSMVYVGLRYVLPTTSGTLAKVPRPD
ncbi:MAG: hypothetical protein WCC87_24430 [Candidatus Korobacteraceae bacterium]